MTRSFIKTAIYQIFHLLVCACAVNGGSDVTLPAYWALDGSDTGLTYNKGPTYSAGRYPGTQAITFNQTPNNYAQTARINLRGKTFTIAAWIKTKAVSVPSAIISDWGDPYQFMFHLNPAMALYFRRKQSSSGFGVLKTASGVVPIGQWCHVAVTWDQAGGVAKLYVNANEEARMSFDTSITWQGPGSTTEIGDSLHASVNNQFSGEIMQLYIFKGAKNEDFLETLRAPIDKTSLFHSTKGNLTGHVTVFELGTPKSRDCLVLCLRSSGCESFNYHPQGKTCELSNVVRGRYPGDFVVDGGAEYYEKLPISHLVY